MTYDPSKEEPERPLGAPLRRYQGRRVRRLRVVAAGALVALLGLGAAWVLIVMM